MAKLHPELHTWQAVGVGQYAERAVLEQLQNGLPDAFDVFHSVDWSTVNSGEQRFGEIDVVVVDPQGHLVLLEVKAGAVEEVPNTSGLPDSTKLIKRYDNHRKEVFGQLNGQLKAMRQGLQREGFEGFKVAHLLVLPDHLLKSASFSIPRERILDSMDVPELCQRVMSVICQGQTERADVVGQRDRLLLFLSNQFRLVPDPTARVGALNNAVTRLSDGLATWVPRIHSDAGTYVIEATAGSGKTQLALRLLRDASAQGLRCMYVCYNRTLADHIVRVAPAAAQVNNFHELAVDHFRRKHGSINFTEPGIFDRAAKEFVSDRLAEETLDQGSGAVRAQLNLLVIDEMQDMEPEWVDALVCRLKSDGRLYLMGDSQQSIYPRAAFALQGAVQITCDDNYRTPRQLVKTINLFGLSENSITARCPERGDDPDIRTYPESDVGGVKALDAAVTDLLKKGVDQSQIAVLTFAGRGRSAVLAKDIVGGLQVRKFTGRFDVAGNAEWTHGTLLVETLFRFKGQAAPYVILCEVDFVELDDKTRRKLFVGMTRAQMHLTVLTSKQAELALVRSINGE